MPAKKEDYEKIFNRILDINIEWHRLKLEDLIQLAVVFNHPEILIKKIGGKLEREVTRKRILDVGAEILEGVLSEWEGPLAKLYKKVIGKEEQKP